MPANTQPIFTLTPDVSWGTSAITTANTAMDGTGTVVTVFTAATNGSYVQKLRVKPAGTNVQTVVRVFINNGSTNATAANNILFDEITIPATTASNTTALSAFEIPLNFALQSGYKLNVTIGTTVAAGVYVSVVGGDY
jgi:hypothetical protein